MADGLEHLVAVIQAAKAWRGRDMITATVDVTGAVPETFTVRARTPEGTIEASSDHLRVTYHPATRERTVQERGHPPITEVLETFPMQPLVLGMFSPLDLPIWGGLEPNPSVVAATRDGGLVRLELAGLSSSGHAVVDLDTGIVVDLDYLGRRYTTRQVRQVDALLAD
ncbi:hypothetical protein E7744_12280 [Citricoccus sp. SGAir0253]|uniref:hypothetical protein n=1 Tax=Citricoccus sp. SGAir0253 TaxID=2567881 RepID=UPI0010CD01EE|nr:hypothetical protein [Citricoccus sp. SGAir0253]QCU78824.1 hypothetical protein E7744_12280 [Citricoccus sp. SGAir0253]